ncbi:YggS family pyridoxal phosphate-dependent enzyme [Buchnera aphidicola]|uniref:YggS family pyridoxal phosphate-dependent enzyme n=1 Tax=Buchnera aphidicola TaxID=9 RepID=UPI00346448CD
MQNIIEENNLPLKNIRIIAVTKNQNINVIKEAISIGIKEFGENYIQESIIKIQKLKNYKNITWHFIGKIQSKKTKLIAQNFHWCQTIDRKKIAILLNKHRPKNLPRLNVLIQINSSQEKNKNGVCIKDYKQLAEEIYLMPHLNLRGIMAMPSINNDPIINKVEYKKIKIAFQELKKQYISVDTLSLGTSFDIKQSLLSTSNMIRIGRCIFNKEKSF